MTDFELMGAALDEARKAAALGEVPVGAVVARNGQIVAAAHNTRETEKNALHHAELLAIDAACKALGGWRLWECELFVTLEPCPMCAGAIINSRIRRVVYGAADTLDFLDANGIVPPSCELNTLEGREEDVGAFGVQSFPTSHDVPCVGYRIHTPDGKTMTIATDLGVLTPPVHEALAGCDLVALESNYDLHMLRSGPYPYYLRARIESVRGHLSNDECAAKLLELIQEGCKKFALCHLSQENNTPMLALQTVFSTLGTAGVMPDKDCIVQTQRRNEVSPALAF